MSPIFPRGDGTRLPRRLAGLTALLAGIAIVGCDSNGDDKTTAAQGMDPPPGRALPAAPDAPEDEPFERQIVQRQGCLACHQVITDDRRVGPTFFLNKKAAFGTNFDHRRRDLLDKLTIGPAGGLGAGDAWVSSSATVWQQLT
jgi:hypothetical protein